jgi:hypothetical protein
VQRDLVGLAAMKKRFRRRVTGGVPTAAPPEPVSAIPAGDHAVCNLSREKLLAFAHEYADLLVDLYLEGKLPMDDGDESTSGLDEDDDL